MDLTEEQLAEVDRIIASTETQYGWDHAPDGDSYNTKDMDATLLLAARRVREYLRSLKDAEPKL